MNLPFWPFYVGDYLADTMHLTAEEHGAYLLLMMAYWKRQKPLDDDAKDLAQIAHLSLSDFEKCRPRLAPFFKIEGGKWVHGRLERDLLKQKSKYHAQSQAAAKTNAKRYGQQEMSLSDTLSESLSVSQPEPEPEPEPKAEPDTHSSKKNGEAKRLRELWCASYLSERGVKYSFAGGKDGEAVNRLLNVVTPEEAVKLAEAAWEKTDASTHWNCVKQSATLAMFASKINEIRSELSRSDKTQVKPTLSLSELKTILKSKEELAAEFKEKWSSPCAMGPMWREDAKRLEWVAMRSEIRKLNRQIANMA